MFTLTASHLDALCVANEFAVDRTQTVFFGLRGCLPVEAQDATFRTEQALTVAEVDHTHARCTIGQWRPQAGTFAVFPGSTIPHRRHVAEARAQGGAGANQLLTGYYTDYRKGFHRADSPAGHPAFRQGGTRPVQRTVDDLDYQGDDRVEFSNPGDNLHAAFCASSEVSYFASAGCQVVVGFPKCAQRGSQPATGPWADFFEAAYGIAQTSFAYLLLHGREAARIGQLPPGAATALRVRFGSRGDRSGKVQEALARKGHYEGRVDGDFGPRSTRALLSFQRAAFGAGGVDGIAGPQTLSALGL
jgi:hypothetical protein